MVSIPQTAEIRIPDVNDPSKWFSFIDWDVSGPVTPFLGYGWMIFFLRNPAGPATASVTPSLLPTHVPKIDNTALSPSVVLPESSGFNQYWVTVLDQHRWAKLETPEWTVIFMIPPAPGAGPAPPPPGP